MTKARRVSAFNNAGRIWTVAVNVDAIKRVRSLLGAALMDEVGGELLERLIAEPVLLWDVIYALCKPEADSEGMSDEEFGRADGRRRHRSGHHGPAGGAHGFFPEPEAPPPQTGDGKDGPAPGADASRGRGAAGRRRLREEAPSEAPFRHIPSPESGPIVHRLTGTAELAKGPATRYSGQSRALSAAVAFTSTRPPSA